MCNQNIDSCKDEIDLSIYFKFLFKHRNTILAVFFVCVIPTTVISFLLPKIYDVSMDISSVIEIRENKEPFFLDSQQNLKTKIEKGVYNLRIMRALNLPFSAKIEFKTLITERPDLIKVSLEEEQKDIAFGMIILNQLYFEIAAEYEEIIKLKMQETQDLIYKLSGQIEKNNYLIKLCEEIYGLLDKRSRKLENKIEKNKKIDISIYSDAIRKNSVYPDKVYNQYSCVLLEKNIFKKQMKDKRVEIESLKTKLDVLKLRRERIRNVALVGTLHADFPAVRPVKKQYVFVASVLGLILGIYIAFLRESRNKGSKNL